MPFLAEEHYQIPSTDLLTWMFDDCTPYDEDKPIYIDAVNPSRSISRRQARSMVRRLAAGFSRAGLKRGDCVCLVSFNDIYYSIAFLGIIAAGGIFTGLNPSYTVFELTHAIRTADITHFLVEPAFLPKVLQASKECAIPTANIFAFDVLERPTAKDLSVQSWDVLHTGQEEMDWARFDDPNQSKKTIVARLFSSGTTGLPKAMDLSVSNFVSHWSSTEARVRRLLSNPFFHISQVPRAHTSPIKGGIVTYVMRRFEIETWLLNISKYNITEVNIVPMMVIRLLSSGLLDSGRYSLKTIRNAWAGSAPLDKSIQARLKEYMQPDAPFNQAWGMSETTCMATMFYYPEQDTTGSVGRLLPNCDAKIVDEEGHDISGAKGPNGMYLRGELCVRGPIIVSGYYKNKEANERDWDKDGYFHTGDIAYCEESTRKWFIVDRKKASELIKVRGFQVAPTEIEGVLLLHPKIADCAVIGIQHSIEESELPLAYIAVKPGAVVTEADVRTFTQDRLARYKQLEGGIRFLDSIPRNGNGKIQKNVLKKMAAPNHLRTKL
ncbi:uncharacterized protein A1O9_04442 [Exophiala aquamarina CBS 119918]|uniref:AMP-dependent synthetase/ligase domain-containing protein n=1 Tax=Exophiala aquamarina CBS 119918 TaxID=1182545 RepID=A0A072PI86_9EURO|nr:uncharacterized protein A1O9_04442 [Exophiala aquamarina CBS 119918]KEF59596.1 hypothetical protein A1O9_04442 [Exophiala aquamarina CBS 119918]